ncbi:hypothetical protein K438DRAFT_2169887 [Mycena galopus ATCC 62051]|nr:hypothetical protein K438DRAFT_2169887 [Mycena galopus ATCC 62051]
MSTTTVCFAGLAPDVILSILRLSDIYTVLSVSRLWISLIADLRERSFLETPPSDLLDESTTQLIDQVKTVVVGSQTWRTSYDVSSETQPHPTREITVPLLNCVDGRRKVQIINGGRHIMLGWLRALEIWDVMDKRRVWTRATDARQFSAARITEDRILNVAILSKNNTRLDILSIDVQRWNLFETLTIELPQNRRGILSHDAIVGDLAYVILDEEVLLMDWRAQTYVLLNAFDNIHRQHFGLSPGLLTILSLSDTPRLFIYTTAALDFASEWRPVGGLSDPTYLPISHLTPMVVETPMPNDRPINPKFDAAIMSIHECPLQQGTYKISVYLSEMSALAALQRLPPAAVFHYKYTISDTEFRWVSVGASQAFQDITAESLTYSGYAVDMTGIWRIRNPTDENGGERELTTSKLIVPQDRARGFSVSPYNCVTMTVMPKQLGLGFDSDPRKSLMDNDSQRCKYGIREHCRGASMTGFPKASEWLAFGLMNWDLNPPVNRNIDTPGRVA